MPFNSLIASKKTPPRQKHQLISNMGTHQMNAISHMMKKFLNSQYPVSPRVLKKLAKDQDYVRALANGRNNMETKKQILYQKGGLIGLLAPLVGSLISPLLGKILK